MVSRVTLVLYWPADDGSIRVRIPLANALVVLSSTAEDGEIESRLGGDSLSAKFRSGVLIFWRIRVNRQEERLPEPKVEQAPEFWWAKGRPVVPSSQIMTLQIISSIYLYDNSITP
uniref:Uncharacterized protein n=1 Tax=Timema genevievae TaxID=629358 RepID=A0A7R9JSE1_TIMGE|nr:unnamed protein product [Timema genevievae]